MKKLISILLAAAMRLSLTACGSTAAADDTESVPASSDTSTETPPEKPDGTPPDGANGQPGTPPDGNPPDGAPNGQPGGFGGSGEVTQGTSANTISEDTAVTGTSYSSTGDDENALRVDGAAVTLDGISLTINACGKDFLTVNVIPDTQKRTTMLHWRPGSRVNMETDLIGKYVRRIMQCQADGPATPQKSSGINKEFLLQNGFL